MMSTKMISSAVLLTLLVSVASGRVQESQSTEDKNAGAPQPYVQEYSEAGYENWEFGIRIECSGGIAQSTKVNAPIPVLWPEQEIELYEETKSNNIKKIQTKKLRGGGASIMAFVVQRINNGDSVEAILRYRVRRRSTLRPDDTTQFSFAKKLDAKLKGHLKPSPFIESKDKRIRKISDELFEENKDLPAWDQVEAVYSWVRENVAYKFDKQLHTCLEALDSGHGDCEELSSLFIAICRAQGIPARAVWVPGHTYPEFYLVDETGKGHWFPCQAAGQNHEFGEMLEDRPILQKGDRFKTPVSSEVTRYVKAGLSSTHATGALKVEHLMRKAED